VLALLDAVVLREETPQAHDEGNLSNARQPTG
jgi:hypothetical protein